MARSDLLLKLVRAGKSGNQSLLERTVEALIAEERAQQHHVVADNLSQILQEGQGPRQTLSLSLNPLDNKTNQYLLEKTPECTFSDLILDDVTTTVCRELVDEHHRSDLLRSYNLEPRNKILLVGPPGNGKTSLAEALAQSLMVPLLTVRYHAIIGSYLGETANRLRNMFDHVRTRRCVFFFDEFETIAKERGDTHETGEIKRVVSSLLLEMDALPSYVVVVTATNHPELLDRAVWRRFQVRIHLPKPRLSEIEEWLCRFEKMLKQPLKNSFSTLSKRLLGLSFAELEEFGNDVRRKQILSSPNTDINRIISSKLVQWRRRSKATPNRTTGNGH
jgi:SpoVK/Ycf46/Vps4 family AAA+-type ATPase